MLTAAFALGCATAVPPRFVVEASRGPWTYVRYQRVLDLDLPVPDNPGEAHVATYLRRDPTPRTASGTVAVHAEATGLAADVHDALTTLRTYRSHLVARRGHHCWALEGDTGDRWLLWVSGRHVVKVGGLPAAVPEPLVEAYLAPYPSDLGPDGRARPDTASAGPSSRERDEVEEEQDLPAHLREGPPRAPSPDAEPREAPRR